MSPTQLSISIVFAITYGGPLGILSTFWAGLGATRLAHAIAVTYCLSVQPSRPTDHKLITAGRDYRSVLVTITTRSRPLKSFATVICEKTPVCSSNSLTASAWA